MNLMRQAPVRMFMGVFLALGMAACAARRPPSETMPTPGARTQRPYQINGVWYYPIPSAEGFEERGLASWYGPQFHNRATANGEIYDMYAMTAAHKVLPLGTHVKVTNLQNGRSTIVRVNDRGPFVAGRVIDLSYAAADTIGVAKSGLAPVHVEAIQVAAEQRSGSKTYWVPEPVPSLRYGRFVIQIGAFRESDNAYRLARQMASRYTDSKVSNGVEKSLAYYRVHVGKFQDLVLAREELERLRQQGFADAFVVALEN
jgi:rare lipoprotein A